MNKNIVSILVLLSIAFVQPAFSESLPAQTPISPPSDTHFVYRALGNYDRLQSPIVGGLLGAQYAGIPGLVTGLFAGCADEALVYTGMFKQHYLTTGILGMSATSAIDLPYRLSEAIGFIAGIMLSTGQLDQVFDKLGTPISTAIAGGSYAGTYGAIGGVICGALDEMLMSHNVTGKHYLSNMVFGVSSVSLIAPKAHIALGHIPVLKHLIPVIDWSSGLPIKQVFGTGVGAYMSKSEQAQVVRKSPLKLAKELYQLYGNLIPKAELDHMIEKHAIAVVSSQVILAGLSLTFMSHRQNVQSGMEAFGPNAQAGSLSLSDAILSLAGYAPVYFGGQIVSGLVNNYLSTRLTNAIQDRVRHQFLLGELPLKLSSDKDSQALVQKMDEHVGKTTQGGSALVSGALGSSVQGAYHMSFLVSNNALDMVMFLDVYNRLIQSVTLSLAESEASYMPKKYEQETKISILKMDLLGKANIIVAADKTHLLKQKIENALLELRRLQVESELLKALSDVWGMLTNVADFVLSYSLIAEKLAFGTLKFNHYQSVSVSVDSVTSAVSWAGKNAMEVQQVEQSIQALSQLLEKMKPEIDRAEKSLRRSYARGEFGFKLRNVAVGVEDKTLVKVESLEITKGIYAVTGKSGCGKSTFFSKFKGIKYGNGWASGELTLVSPKNAEPNIALVSQEDYLMPYSTLLEIILSESMVGKNSETVAKLKERVLSLLLEIEFHSKEQQEQLPQWLELENNWSSVLSGGQKKKLAILSAIMRAPDILMLDEVFNGLDTGSIKIAQRMLKRYLPNALIFVVDHHAEDNNFGFYDQELHFENQGIHVRELAK